MDIYHCNVKKNTHNSIPPVLPHQHIEAIKSLSYHKFTATLLIKGKFEKEIAKKVIAAANDSLCLATRITNLFSIQKDLLMNGKHSLLSRVRSRVVFHITISLIAT